MVRSRRLEIAEVEADRLRKRLGRNLVGIGVFGSVGRGDDRTGSDIDLVVVAQSQVKIKSRVVSGIPVTFLPLTPEGAREEVYGSRKDLNVALGGWRSLKPLYDPTKFLARLRQRAFHPRPLQFRRASQKALLETFEDLGKLRNAIEAKNRDEMREMAIWFTDVAMGALSIWSASCWQQADGRSWRPIDSAALAKLCGGCGMMTAHQPRLPPWPKQSGLI